MDFSYTPEQVLLQDTVRRLLSDTYGFDERRRILGSETGYSQQHWQQYAELGLLGLPFSQELGGMEASGAELLVTLHEFGRSLILEPYIETVVVCGGILSRMAPRELQERFIPGIVAGEVMLALAHDDVGAPARAVERRGGWRLDGHKRLVVGAPMADSFVVSAQVEGVTSLFMVDGAAPGVQIRPCRLQDGHQAADVVFDGVLVGRTDRIIADGASGLQRVLDDANAALCAEAVGAMEAAVELTSDYLRTRKQFGAPIASFQVLRHKAADMQVALEHARSMAILAMLQQSEDDELARQRAVSAAKVLICRAGRAIGQAAVQLHGAVGMTDEYKVGHLFKRLEAIGKRFGDEADHLERLSACGGAIQ